MLVGEAVQRLMEACLKAGSVALVLRSEALVDEGQRKADKLKLKGALAELKGFHKGSGGWGGMVCYGERWGDTC